MSSQKKTAGLNVRRATQAVFPSPVKGKVEGNFPYLFDALAQQERIKLVFAIISKGFPAYRNLESSCLDFPLLLRIPIADRAAAQEERIELIVPIIAKGLPAFRNIESVGRSNLPLLFVVPFAGRAAAQ